jgi:hypothetical protein
VFPVFGVFTTGRGRSCFRFLRKAGDFSIGRMGNFQPVLTVEGPAIGYPRRTPVSPGRISPVQVLPSQCPQGKSCWKVAPAYRKQPGWPAMLAWYFALRRRTSLNIVERLTGPAFQDEDQSSFRSNSNCAKRGANHARDAPKADHYFRTPKKVFRPIITAASTGGVYRQACNARLQFPQAANKCRSVDDQCGTNANAVGLPLSAFQNYGTR